MSATHPSPQVPFDVVLAGLVLSIAVWAVLAVSVMTSLAPLSRVVPPPSAVTRPASCPADQVVRLACWDGRDLRAPR